MNKFLSQIDEQKLVGEKIKNHKGGYSTIVFAEKNEDALNLVFVDVDDSLKNQDQIVALANLQRMVKEPDCFKLVQAAAKSSMLNLKYGYISVFNPLLRLNEDNDFAVFVNSDKDPLYYDDESEKILIDDVVSKVPTDENGIKEEFSKYNLRNGLRRIFEKQLGYGYKLTLTKCYVDMAIEQQNQVIKEIRQKIKKYNSQIENAEDEIELLRDYFCDVKDGNKRPFSNIEIDEENEVK